MEKINDLRNKYILDIFITLFIVVISIPLWLNMNLTASYAEAEAYDNFDYINYEVRNTASYSLAAKTDEEAVNSDTSNIIIYNDSNTKDDYTVYLVLEDNINFDNMKISINNKIYYLKDFNYELKDGYRYYSIVQDSIVASSENYSICMWNDETTAGESGYITPEFAVNI